jgi:HEAT repeat protein
MLKPDERDTATLTALVNDKERYAIVTAALATLSGWDGKGNLAVIKRAAQMPSLHERIRTAAYVALANSGSDEGVTQLLAATRDVQPDLRNAAIAALGHVAASEPRTREALRTALGASDLQTVVAAVDAVRERKDKALLPAIQALKAHPPAEAASQSWFPGFIDGVIADLSKAP